ncbi:unnamed protein product, partial [Rhizoctonia solani]
MFGNASATSLHGSTIPSKKEYKRPRGFGIWGHTSSRRGPNATSASLPEAAPFNKIPAQTHKGTDSLEFMDSLEHHSGTTPTNDAKKKWKWASKIFRFVSQPIDKKNEDIGTRPLAAIEAAYPDAVMEQTQSKVTDMSSNCLYSDEPRSFTSGELQGSPVTGPLISATLVPAVDIIGSAVASAEGEVAEDETPLVQIIIDNKQPPATIPIFEFNNVSDRNNRRRGTSISRTMSASEVVSLLLEHDCQDITKSLELSTFHEHPSSHGGFSDIFRGELRDGRHVAVKALRVSAESLADNPNHLRQAARELHTWSKCNHPNVMPLLGLAVFRGRIGMVSPWMWNAKVASYLEENRNVNRYRLCVQISEGLSYLHQIRIVHGDLKGANVLISKEGAPVLIDFGNSILKDQTLKFTQARSTNGMTPRWSAAELLTGSSSHTEASDIYALGMEIMTGMLPYQNLLKDALYYKVVMEKALPDRPVTTMPTGNEDEDKLWELLTKCWSFNPEERPTAAAVADT